MKINDRISAIQVLLSERKLDAVIIPSNDPHQSEYVAPHWRARGWVSGFTGSAGTVVITATHAGLWTDSRYFLQAEQQLSGSNMELHKLGVPHSAEHLEWIIETLSSGQKVAIDGNMLNKSLHKSILKRFKAANLRLDINQDLITPTWKDRPEIPIEPVFSLDEQFTGQSTRDKLTVIQEKLREENADHLLITALDDIAWTLNLRGNDVQCNPIFVSYLIIEKKKALLFINPKKLDVQLIGRLGNMGIAILPYNALDKYLSDIDKASTVWYEPSMTSALIADCIKANKKEAPVPPTLLKALKNETEIAQTKEAMIKDGVALTKLYRWIEDSLEHRELLETEVSTKLIEFRGENEGYKGESFPAIVGYKGNGAIVHYHAVETNCASIKKEGILLIDSGGQYLQGTTDITRTIALSTPTAEQKKHFTAVLKGNIAIDRLIFPKGTSGRQIDILARMELWREGLNYGHGTGHGVGFFLNVHEGPQSISGGNSSKAAQAILPGMITSNEPGFYLEDQYGIRIENLILCHEKMSTDFGEFYHFETMTLFPIDLNLIDFDLLNIDEKEWLSNYHRMVYDKLRPSLNAEQQAWLSEKCGLAN